MTRLTADLRVLKQLVLSPTRGNTHQERLDSFYGNQADDYDGFRERLLHGRRELIDSLAFPAGGCWVDLGCGTGHNLELAGTRGTALSQVHLVDLSKTLLSVAKRRVQRLKRPGVTTHLADATTLRLLVGQADLVTFSYSLTMIPDWFSAIENALSMLKPGGTIGVTDFYVSRKHACDSMRQHGWARRTFWPLWFASDNVFLSSDHLPMLMRRCQTKYLREACGHVPYLPLVRAPYYVWIGRK
ncbi:MAG: class I SAM-dependent methyltransferase [Planctomycetota bacterium]